MPAMRNDHIEKARQKAHKERTTLNGAVRQRLKQSFQSSAEPNTIAPRCPASGASDGWGPCHSLSALKALD